MKEYQIRKLAIKEIEKKGGIIWFPPKVKWRKEGDIFSCFDLIVIYPPSEIVFIQLTTLSNIRAREKKIVNWMKYNDVSIYCEVWGYDQNWKIKNKPMFKILNIYGSSLKILK